MLRRPVTTIGGPGRRHRPGGPAPPTTALRTPALPALLLVGLLTATTCVRGQELPRAPELTDEEKLYGLSLFWQEANYSFAFFDQVPELDWDGAYRDFIPRVLATTSTYDYYRQLQRFAALLQDGHTRVRMPRSLRPAVERREAYPWLVTELVGGRLLVRRVGASLVERIPVHSEILEIDGRPAVEVGLERRAPRVAASTDHDRRARALRNALVGPADEEVEIHVETPSGQQRRVVLNRDRHTRDDAWIPEEEPPEPFEMRWVRGREAGIAHVALHTFDDPAVVDAFEAALPVLRRARALILDLRRNGGGSSGNGYRIASWLTDRPLPTSAWRTREHRAAYKAWGRFQPSRSDYWEMDAWHDGGTHGTIAPADGPRLVVPTVVLQGTATLSAAEDFLVAVETIPHLTTVGGVTGGSTGQPLVFELPGGGTGYVVSKRDTYPDGRDFVGVGIAPDVRIEPTIEDVRAGRDPALERAVEILEEALAGGG